MGKDGSHLLKALQSAQFPASVFLLSRPCPTQRNGLKTALEVYSVPPALGMLQRCWCLPTAHLYKRGWVCSELTCCLGQGNEFTLQSLIWHFCQQTQVLPAAAASLCAAPRPCTLLSTTDTSPRVRCFPLSLSS